MSLPNVRGNNVKDVNWSKNHRYKSMPNTTVIALFHKYKTIDTWYKIEINLLICLQIMLSLCFAKMFWLGNQGQLPYQIDGGDRRKFLKEPLKRHRNPFCGCGSNNFYP